MPLPNGKAGFGRMRTIFFFGLILILGIAFLYLTRPFFYPVFWAAIIAVMFHPFYQRLNGFMKMPSISSLISLILVIVIIFLPLLLVILLLVQQSIGLYHSLSTEAIASNVQGFASWLGESRLGPYLEEARNQWTGYAANAARAISIFLFENVKSITQHSVRFVFTFFIMLYTLYYFFKDGEQILKRFMHLSPLGDKYETMLYDKFRATSAAALKSTFIVGGTQGLIGVILFWITGVPGAFVWGVIMMALSIIPAVGSFTVWLPVGLIMLALGQVWQGITILLVGAFIISLVDNLLRPPLVGKGSEMHPVFVLFSTLGGIFLFGVSGFIIGPIIAALFLAVISIYSHYYKNELAEN